MTEREQMRVFVSYRRDDVPDATDRLAENLREHFGRDNVFIDIDSVEIGADFADVIRKWVGRADVFLAVIGRSWLDTRRLDGQRRIDDENDYVRIEIEAALEHSRAVVPVLVHGATAPAPSDLPASVAPLMRRNAVELTRRHWETDVADLIGALDRVGAGDHIDSSPGEPRTARPARSASPPIAGEPEAHSATPDGARAALSRRRPGRRVLLSAVAALILLGILAALLSSGGPKKQTSSSTVAGSPGTASSTGPPRVLGTIKVGRQPNGVGIQSGIVWVANQQDNSVSRIDANTGRVVGPAIDLGQSPLYLTTGFGAVWLDRGSTHTIAKIDAQSSAVSPDAISDAGYAEVGQGGLWVFNGDPSTIRRVDPASGTTIAGSAIPLPHNTTWYSVGPEGIWAATPNQLDRLDPHSGAILDSVAIPHQLEEIEQGFGSVWTTDNTGGTVMRFTGGRLVKTFKLAGVWELAIGPDAVWVDSDTLDEVVRIDPTTNTVGTPIGVGSNPASLAVGQGGVWVANTNDGTVTRIQP